MLILASIDVTKIDKAHIKSITKKDGTVGKYLDLIITENREGVNQYGNLYMVRQGVSKEARDAGTKGAILGNGKTFGDQQAPAQRQPEQPPNPNNQPEDDDIPF
jgi:hypothetical protein